MAGVRLVPTFIFPVRGPARFHSVFHTELWLWLFHGIFFFLKKMVGVWADLLLSRREKLDSAAIGTTMY